MIESLAYIGFTSPRAEAWTTFGPEVLGLQLADARADGAVRLRNDDALWRIAIHPGDVDNVAYLGWVVDGPAALSRGAARLEAAGIGVHRDDGTLAAVRNVESAAWFTDPFGFRHELVHGLATEPGSFTPGRPGVKFVTGEEGLGHAVLIVPDWDAATRFFVDVLGFRVSDDIEADIKVRFLHCNPRHHTLAFSAIPGMAGFHHLMLEVAEPEQVRTAYAVVRETHLPVAMTLGEHPNDEMYSFYVRTPSGFEIEYGAGGRVIDTDKPWEIGHYDVLSTWGHKPPGKPLVPGILHAAGAAS